MNLRSCALAAAFATLGATACDDSATSGLPDNTSAAITTYARIVSATYEDAATAGAALEASVAAFVASPTAQGLDDAREAWLDSREPYLQTEVFRFYDGPIDDPTDGPEGLMNAWPLDEAYIDYVDGDADAGIINGTETIDAPTLEALNEQGGEENIATGYHAIEFLLWGQDHSATGPGDRPYTDYVDGVSGTAANPHRRATYLQVVTRLLVEHLDGLVAAWRADTAGNYRASFEAVRPEEGLRRILTGMIVLSGFETGGERLQTALDSGDQEDEHSCFSDNTHRDMVQDVQGVWNVWHGSYTRTGGATVSGTGVREVIAAIDAELAAALDARIDESLTLAKALQPPFDQEIAIGNEAGRARVQALVTSLHTQEGLLQDVFRKLDLSVPAPE
ncbi:MAG: iron-regulated protein [Deltaproteobacteria bacterium]|nr:iron-regulated protein [Deltaproteobacteria bacterium]MCB9786665.1 iron-regulated protein [Deltaproteobacteria bacterium]